MAAVLLSAAMIVRDEEANLPACLESIRDLVDEIVIVDTGSRDATVSIAESFGARVVHHPWTGNFAESRNVGLEMARGAWILYIDADERARTISREAMHARLREADEVALRIRLRPFAGATPHWEYRLWRSDPRIRFAGKMHEKVIMAIMAVAEADGRVIGESELFLEHVGYDGDQTHKHRRNLPLLEAQLTDRPADAYSWHHLAAVLDGLGETERSDAALQRSLDAARETTGSTGVLPFVRLIKRRRESGLDITDVLEEALSRHPDSFALLWLKLLEEIDDGDYENALRKLELFDIDSEMPVEDTVAYPAEMFGARAAEARGVCLFKLGRYAEAAVAYAQAEQLEPDAPQHRLKRVVAEHRAARAQQAAGPATTEPNGLRWPARALLRGLTLEIAGLPVGIIVTDAMRAAAVRALLGRMAPVDREPAVQLAFGGNRIPPPARPPDDVAGMLELWHDDESLSVTYGPLVGGRAAADRAALGGYAADLHFVFHRAGPFLLAALLADHGRFVLHGAAIARAGRGVLILGATGTGKSTAVLGALEEGWGVLSDDLVVVSPGPSGPVVSGIPKPLAVPYDVLSEQRRRAAYGRDPRRRVQVRYEEWDRGAQPVEAVVMLGHGTGSEPVVEPVARPQLIGMLLHACFSQQPSNIRRFFPLAAAISDRQAFRLLHPRPPEKRARRTARALGEQLGG